LSKVDDRDSRVQFADGKAGYLAGKVEIPFIIWDSKFKRMLPTFYVLDKLTCPFLIGRDLLDQTLAFRSYRTAMTIEDEGRDLPEISTILWFNTPERFLAGRRHIRAPEPLSAAIEVPPTRPVTTTMRARINAFMNSKSETDAPASVPTHLPSFEKRLNERDTRELHRREVSKREISQLDTAEARARAQEEEDVRVEEYERNRRLVARAREQATVGDPMAGSSWQGAANNVIREPQPQVTLEPMIADSTFSIPQPIFAEPETLPPLPKQRFLERIILKWVL